MLPARLLQRRFDYSLSLIILHHIRAIKFFLGATGQSFAHFGQGIGPIQLDNVQCTGTETQLQDCSLIRTHNCAHYEDAGVTCVGQLGPPTIN